MWKKNDIFVNCCRRSCYDLWQHLLVVVCNAVTILHICLQHIDLHQLAMQSLSNCKEHGLHGLKNIRSSSQEHLHRLYRLKHSFILKCA